MFRPIKVLRVLTVFNCFGRLRHQNYLVMLNGVRVISKKKPPTSFYCIDSPVLWKGRLFSGEVHAKPICHAAFLCLCMVFFVGFFPAHGGGGLFASKPLRVLYSPLGCLCSATQRLSKSYRNVPEDIKGDNKHITSAAVNTHGNIRTWHIQAYNVREQN